MRCPKCDGEGYISEYCVSCNGSGEGMHDGYICRTCKGKGACLVECDECNGIGEVDDEYE